MPILTENGCANCQQPYNAVDLYCAKCGCILPHVATPLSSQATSTHLLGEASQPNIDLRWGTGYFHQRARLFLQLEDSDAVVAVPLASSSAVMGRNEPQSPVEVDLTPYNGVELGSRAIMPASTGSTTRCR